MLRMSIIPREILCFPRYVCEQPLAWHGVRYVNHMYVNKKAGCSCIQKSKKKASVGVEHRACGDPHRSEKREWSAGDMRQWSKQKKVHRHPVSLTGVLL